MAVTRQSRAVTINADAALVVLPGAESLTDWAIACWVRGLAENKRFIVVGTTEGATPSVVIERSGGVLQAVITDDSANAETLAGAGFESGWNHVALVSAGGVLRLYLNGIERDSAPPPSGPFAAGDFVMLGDDSGDAPNFDMAHAAIWGRALLADEVAALSSAGRGHDLRESTGDYIGGEDGPVHWWPCDGIFKGWVIDRGLAGSSHLELTGEAAVKREEVT